MEENKENQKKRKNIIEAVVFIILSIVIIILFGLSTDSLLLALLIFAIYLIVSGKISQIKFKDMEIMLKESQLKPLGNKESLTKSFTLEEMPELISAEKEGIMRLPKILKEIQEKPKNLRVLHIREREGGGEYVTDVLRIYLQYFTHVVFLDKEGRYMGYANAINLINMYDTEHLIAPTPEIYNFTNFINSINTWHIEQYPLLIKTYVIIDMTRKQILDKMNNTGYYTLPVIGENFKYLGFINHDTVINQILNDLYRE